MMPGVKRKERHGTGQSSMKTKQGATNNKRPLDGDTPRTETLSLSYTIRHQEALELEISLLQATLKRNDASHRKTQYLRRLHMALKSVVKTHQLHTLWSELQMVISRDLPQLEQELQLSRRRDEKAKKKKEIFWELRISDKATPTAPDNSPSVHDMFKSIQRSLFEISERSSKGTAECLSRLEYAASACLMEIARGFFLALVTVAVASVARIRTLLLRLENHVNCQMQLLLYKSQTKAFLVTADMKSSGSASSPTIYAEYRQTFALALEAMVESTSDRKDFRLAGLSSTDEVGADEVKRLDDAETGDQEYPDSTMVQQSRDDTGISNAVNGGDELLLVGTSQDQNDTGESMFDEEANSLDEGRLSILPSLDDNAGVDHNATLLAKVKRKTVQKRMKKGSNEDTQKSVNMVNATGANREPTTPSVAPPRKGKKKKGGGRDFFDLLFGS